jgi:hypothetical protein
MHTEIRVNAMFALALLLTVGNASAQAQTTSADVTFVVPLNLTNLASDISKVRVRCYIYSWGFTTDSRVGEMELAVLQRQVVTTANVVVLIPPGAFGPNPTLRDPLVDKTRADYECHLSLYSPATGWNATSGLQPVPRAAIGNFAW